MTGTSYDFPNGNTINFPAPAVNLFLLIVHKIALFVRPL